MKYLLILFLLASTFVHAQKINIIPQPVNLQQATGDFKLSKNTVIRVKDQEDKKAAVFLNDYLQLVYGFTLDVDQQEGKDYIRLTTKKFIKAPDKDAYSLIVTKNGIVIEGDTYAGTFYGVQTLIQLFPAYDVKPLTNSKSGVSISSLMIPFVTVQDHPRFNYRGMHLDVGRHFFPLSFIKKYIDYLALHKMNYFHWHLTEDQGWRIQINKYPKLTEVGAWRNGTIIGRYPGTGNDNQRYGGFYTQDEVKEIVRYATDRHITVVPEIEMPGHSSAAIAAYPWLSCFPQKETDIPKNPSKVSQQTNGKKVQETWGVFEDVYCAGKDSTFIFLENVIDEVLALFPSKYIHVGGDESPKAHWKKCPHCQARIKKEGLKDEHELQSYFIQRMEKYLNAKGRILIGWDEILEGGLAPNAVVMSWRGEKGGIEAAKQKHNVIMTPEFPLYLNHAQSRNEDSITQGGYNPLEAVYNYEPIPKELNAEQAKYVLGAQGNLWSEYTKYPSKVEYMIFPRMSAVSEVLWSPKEKKSWASFETRLKIQFQRYDLWNANYSKAYYGIQTMILPAPNFNGLQLKVDSKNKTTTIKYETIGKHSPLPYTKPIIISSDREIVVTSFANNKLANKISIPFSFNKATGKKISITTKPTEKYPGQQGAFGLVNGIQSKTGLSFPDWLGWIGDDLEATIEFGKKENFTTVKMHTLDQNNSWIYLPKYIEVFVSDDGKKFRSVGKGNDYTTDTMTLGYITVSFSKQSARYLKLTAKNYGVIPDGQPGAGNKAWLFADEIKVE
ncbi:MAG: family 20 glycosylhydrolase [Chitinophagaceae bacterium]